MLANMARDDPRVGIEAAAGRQTNYEPNGFTLIEIVLSRKRQGGPAETNRETNQEQRRSKKPIHDFLLLHGLAPRLDPSVITPIPLWRGLKQVSSNHATGKNQLPNPKKDCSKNTDLLQFLLSDV
jgi:hypothetical protein